ncbi:ion transporter [Longimicrobium sp.]|uniref:ion transporter n=1 Tax=Longimicrobium sp. TaxID=2029185 RepID=UPI002C84E42B|nr:ion transporter [Longimicrobium sp.]HSU16124.1 ion transporter [Longimicrobium sp.]
MNSRQQQHQVRFADCSPASPRHVALAITRRRVWEILDPDDGNATRAERAFGAFILALIALNVAAVVLQSVRSLELRFSGAFRAFEVFSVLVFSAEYLARVWSCTEDPRYRGPVRGRLRFALSPMALVDVLAVLPFFAAAGAVDLRVLRAARLFRLVRLLKATRYIAAMRVFRHVLRTKREELVLTTAIMSMLLVVAASVMYFAENEAQPQKFSSIPESMWWAVATLTTVGYGDVYPVTPLGRLAGGCIAILGLGFFALPTAILGAGFVDAVQMLKAPPVCPHCGKSVARPGEGE